MKEAYREFLKFCRHRGFRPVERAQTPYGEFFIGETDKEFDLHQFPEYPEGFYQTFWVFAGAPSGGKLDVARWLEFRGTHDQHLSEKQRREARIAVARLDAEYWMQKNIETGRYH